MVERKYGKRVIGMHKIITKILSSYYKNNIITTILSSYYYYASLILTEKNILQLPYYSQRHSRFSSFLFKNYVQCKWNGTHHNNFHLILQITKLILGVYLCFIWPQANNVKSDFHLDLKVKFSTTITLCNISLWQILKPGVVPLCWICMAVT